MKKIILFAMLILTAVLMSACIPTNGNESNIEPDNLLIKSVRYKEADPYYTQYVYEIKDIEFPSTYTEEDKKNVKKNSKYVVSKSELEEGHVFTPTINENIKYTAGKKVSVLRPKVIEKEDTYVVYAYYHTLKVGLELVPSTENLYNSIFECTKENLYISYVYP